MSMAPSYVALGFEFEAVKLKPMLKMPVFPALRDRFFVNTRPNFKRLTKKCKWKHFIVNDEWNNSDTITILLEAIYTLAGFSEYAMNGVELVGVSRLFLNVFNSPAISIGERLFCVR